MNINSRLFGPSILTPICSALLVIIATATAIADNHNTGNHGEQGHNDQGVQGQTGVAGFHSPTTIEGFSVDYHLTLGSHTLGSEVGYFTAGKMVEDPPGHKTTGSGPSWVDDGGLEIDPYTYSKTGEKTGEVRLEMADSSVMVRTLNYTSQNSGTGTWSYTDQEGTETGDLTFEVLETNGQSAAWLAAAQVAGSEVGQGPIDGNHTTGGPDDHGGQGHDDGNRSAHTDDQGGQGYDDGNHTAGGPDMTGEQVQNPANTESESLPTDKVTGFVNNWMAGQAHYLGAKVMWAEKHRDLANEDNFVYEVGLNNGIALIFDKNNTFLHSIHENEFADHETEELKDAEIPVNVKDAINGVHPNAKIIEVEKEFSLEPTEEGQEKKFVYLAIIEKDGQEFEVALGPDAKVYHTHKHEKSDFEEWKEPELPSTATNVLNDKYKDGGEGIGYWVEERPGADGTMEFVAHLDDEREIIFDANGTEIGVRDPWKERLQQVDAGLKFDVARSKWGTSSNGGNFIKGDEASPAKTNGGNGSGAFVHIKKVATDEEGSMLYRIALMNKSSVEGNATATDFDLASTVLDANTSLNLTFTYAMGPPRYFAVSGAEVTAFKHRRPEWDKPGSFTIQAKTVNPVASNHNPDDSVSSTFGILVEMGGERHHEGAIFVANVIPQDIKGPDLSSPWNPVTGFRLYGLPDANATVKAYLPKQLVQHKFGIWDRNDLKAAISRDDGTLSFIDFLRTPYEGYEPDGFGAHSQNEFKLDETHFGLDEHGQGLALEGTQADQIGGGEDDLNDEGNDVENSFIDFDGDGFVDSMLGISLDNASWPGEIQIGDPWLDPFASINVDDFGSISGSVTTSINGSPTPLSDFGIWIIDAN